MPVAYSDNYHHLPHWIQNQIVARGVSDPAVIEALERIPREIFVPEHFRSASYCDCPLPIGYDQTISQPFIVAYMTALANINLTEKVLEIGTGSGYQTAVLSQLARKVYSIEIISPLAIRAAQTLSKLKYSNITLKEGDGHFGWSDAAPFDVILLTAAPAQIPDILIEQLKINGRLIAPLGDSCQEIVRWTKLASGIKKESFITVKFVPMTGKNCS